ncbi:hypothetical protein [Bartonella birtlesii]|uniref:hypothetical protein n=1 Tax=Bartonella birtlesii TaxID=111504 RepID=UPI00042295FD|nr:hypothetical protein [Bartonella birtlesii]
MIKNFSGYADENGKSLQKYNLQNGFQNTSIKIEKNDIFIQREGAYGLYFNVLALEELAKILRQWEDEKLLESKTVVTGKAFVYLSQTNMTVPDGIAIYVKGAKNYGIRGTLEFSEKTKIFGDLLLKAESQASLLVKASTSSLMDGMLSYLFGIKQRR